MRAALSVAVAVLVLGNSFALAKDAKLIGLMALHGSCKTLVVQGKDRTSDCAGKLINMSYNSGRTGFYFVTNDGAVFTFSGEGDKQIKIDENNVVSPVDMLILPVNGKPESLKAVGECRYTNPYNGPSPVTCHAETAFGSYDGSFLTDGAQPEVKRF